MKLGHERLERLERYCEEVAEYYPVRCEVHIEHGESEQDSDWGQVMIHDLTTSNGGTKSAMSPQSPAVGVLEAWVDDKMVQWFGRRGK